MYIYIEVDTNDADYIGNLSEISQESLDIIMPLIEAIKQFKPYKSTYKDCLGYECENIHRANYPIYDCFNPNSGEKSPEELYPEISEDVHESFLWYCPSCEWGFHTIKKIIILDKIEDLL